MTVQMQGRNTATGALVSWLADAPDWTGTEAPVSVSDVAVYTRGSAASSPVIVPIVCSIIYPRPSATTMVGVGFVISGTITRPGTVSIAGLGAPTVSGLTWSYLWTPVVGDIGSKAITVTATDASNGTTSTVSVTCTVVAAAVFPGGITPLAWFNGPVGATFVDTAGATPATAIDAPVRRLNDVAPLTGNWHTPADGIARRAPTGLHIEPAADPLQTLIYSGTASFINLTDSTLVVSWVQRYGDATMALAGSPPWGVAPGLAAYANGGGNLLPGCTTTLGARHDLVVRWTPTAIKATLMTNGVITGNTTVSLTISAGTTNDHGLHLGDFQSYFYGLLAQLLVVNRAVTDIEATNLLAYVNSIPLPDAFPLDRPLIATTGDSQVNGVGVVPYVTWRFAVLRALRATYEPENLNTAIVGTGVNGHAGYIAPYYNAIRSKHVAVCAAGTNDLATHNDASAVLPAYYVQLDAMRAQGWKVVACTVLPRSGSFAGGADQTYYNAQRAIFNSTLRAGWTAHADAFVDTDLLTGMGADGDSTNPTYYNTDQIHMTAAAYALYQVPMIAAIGQLLAA